MIPFLEPPMIVFVEEEDWATSTVSKPAMLIGSIMMMAAPIVVQLGGTRQLRLARPLPGEMR